MYAAASLPFVPQMARLAKLGLDVHVTEMDVICGTGCSLEQQAAVYRSVLAICLAQPACKNFETWGFTDRYTWRGQSARPLPFDASMRPKPAATAMLAELRNVSADSRSRSRGVHV